MLQQQYPYIDEQGKEHFNLVKHYSDKGFYIRQLQTNIEYTEAVDIYPCKYTYIETNKEIGASEDER